MKLRRAHLGAVSSAMAASSKAIVWGRAVLVFSQFLLKLDLVLKLKRFLMNSMPSFPYLCDGSLGLTTINLERERSIRDILLFLRIFILLFDNVHELLSTWCSFRIRVLLIVWGTNEIPDDMSPSVAAFLMDSLISFIRENTLLALSSFCCLCNPLWELHCFSNESFNHHSLTHNKRNDSYSIIKCPLLISFDIEKLLEHHYSSRLMKLSCLDLLLYIPVLSILFLDKCVFTCTQGERSESVPFYGHVNLVRLDVNVQVLVSACNRKIDLRKMTVRKLTLYSTLDSSTLTTL